MKYLVNILVNGITVITLAAFIQSCGSSSSTTTTTSTTVTLTGVVQVESSDITTKPANDTRAKLAGSNKVALDGATVTIYKKMPDGSESLVDTTTADSNGSYSFSALEKADGADGDATDFYYEIRATSGTLDVRSPVAPTADTTVNVNPETNLAAIILSDIADVPTSTSETPTPNLELIEATRTLVEQNAGALASSITIPSVSTASSSDTTNIANGISAAGGNAEKMFKAVQFSSEGVWLKDTENSPTDAQGGAYIKRLIRESCDQPQTNPLPNESADVMGALFVAGTTYTPTQVVASYNNVASVDVDLATVVAAYKAILDAVDTNFDAASTSATAISAENQIALYSKRGLEGTTFTATSALEADQVLAFLLSIPGTGNMCNLATVNVVDVLADLTSNSTLAAAHISDVQIYHNGGFGCSGSEGHFRADVEVYTPTGTTVTGVTIGSTDSSALGGDGSETLSSMGNRWDSNTNGVCVTLGSAVTYTVTATLSSGSPLTTTVDRNHPSVPEAATTVGGSTTSNDSNNPDKVRDKRPLYSWGAPATVLATVTDAPAGSKIKYTYEFAHIDVTDSPVSPLSSCDSVSSNALYEVNSFLPTADCDPAVCATASSKSAANISCRINIQTYLVDDADNYLGQAAGNFSFFCVDTNGDTVCGD